MTLVWSENYSVSISQIDEQHKKFFAIFNKAESALNETDSDQKNIKIGEIFSDLKSYANYHFTFEEMYFDKFNYERSVEHKSEHKKFMEDVNDLLSSQGQKSNDTIFKIITFLENWLVGHISYSDKLYSSCFRKNGLE